MSRLKNGSISFRFSNDSHMEIRSIKFFTVKFHVVLKYRVFFYPAFSKRLKLFCSRCLILY